MADVSAQPGIAVIGCGNLTRSDDGLGPHVVRLLAERGLAARAGVRLLDAGTDGAAVMYAARGSHSLIVIDAARTNSPAGTVFEIPGSEVENDAQPALSLHEFRWDHALYAGRRLYGGGFPRDVTVLLVEAASTGYGIGLSPAVAAAAERVAHRVDALVQERLASGT
jgi:hydrogenase maturation protease